MFKISKFVSVKEAAELVGYTTDYISCLAREGKIQGKRDGRKWLVDRDSVKLFQLQQGEGRKKRRQELSAIRKKEKLALEIKRGRKGFDSYSLELQALATSIVIFIAIIITTSLSYTLIDVHPDRVGVLESLSASVIEFKKPFTLDFKGLAK